MDPSPCVTKANVLSRAPERQRYSKGTRVKFVLVTHPFNLTNQIKSTKITSSNAGKIFLLNFGLVSLPSRLPRPTSLHKLIGKMSRPFVNESFIYQVVLKELATHNPAHAEGLSPECYHAYSNAAVEWEEPPNFCDRNCGLILSSLVKKEEKAVLILEDLAERPGEKYR